VHAGLSTAWHLQQYGVEVTVVDKGSIGSGASWGNAGWITPGLVTPLADPGAWRQVLGALTDPNAALQIPARLDPALWKVLLRFGRNMTHSRWDRTMDALQPITGIAVEAFAMMTHGGITSPVTEAPYVLGFSSRKEGTRYEAEIRHLRELGQHLDFTVLDSPADVPQFSPAIAHAIRVTGQSYLDPGHFVADLARSVRENGGRIIEGWNVTAIHDDHVSVPVPAWSSLKVGDARY
jgi:D-amino-acid dehydrogenase